MTNEEFIYQLTRIVYRHLGSVVERPAIESLVGDLFQFVRSQQGEDSRPSTAASRRGSPERLVISVFGMNQPGIVSAITRVLADGRYSIADIDQTLVQDKFAMVMIVDSSGSTMDLGALKKRLSEVGDQLGVRVYAQREDLFNAMHRV